MPVIQIRIERRQQSESPRRRRKSLRIGGAAVALGLAYALVGGVAGADPVPTDTSGVVAILGHTVINTTLAAHATNSPVVVSAATTVPYDATKVRLFISVSATKSNGSLDVFPTGDEPDGSHTVLSWEAGQSSTVMVVVGVGVQNKVSVRNVSSGTTKVLAKIEGYVPSADYTIAADDTDGNDSVFVHGYRVIASVELPSPGLWLVEWSSQIWSSGLSSDGVEVTCAVGDDNHMSHRYGWVRLDGDQASAIVVRDIVHATQAQTTVDILCSQAGVGVPTNSIFHPQPELVTATRLNGYDGGSAPFEAP